MNKILLYKKAYGILQDSTPLKLDCGSICNRKCCNGNEENGMHLYPGEISLHEGVGDFLTIRRELFKGTDIHFGVCRGSCDRQLRPLACRIYPLVPYMDKYGRLQIIEDPRAKYYCPLLYNSEKIKISPVFKRNVRRVFQLLIRDNEIKGYLLSLSEVLDEYLKFTG